MLAARVALIVLCGACVASTAGCGGGGGASPSVASLPGAHDAATTGSATPAPSGPIAGGSVAMKLQDGAKFSACMRAHGVPSFPDPSPKGIVQFGRDNGIDPSSPTFQRALTACRATLPNGGRPSPQQLAKAQQSALRFSACMRRHGLKDFPDPKFTGGGITLSLRGGPGSDLDPASPLFQRAQTACRGLAGVKGPAGSTAGPK